MPAILLGRVRRLLATASVRSIGLLAAGALATSCGREPTGMDGAAGVARLDLGPLFQTIATSGGDVTQIKVTVYLVNTSVPPGASDRRKQIQSLAFALSDARYVQEDATNVTIKIDFPLQGGAAVYEVEGGAYDASGTRLYDVPAVQFTNAQVSSGGAVTVSTTAVYVGPGSQAVKVVIAPRSAQLRPGETQTLSATAFDAAGSAIAAAPLRWQADNPQVAFFRDNRSGVLVGGTIGSTIVHVGIAGLQISDAIPVVVSLTPTGLSVVQGGGQTAFAGDQLPQTVRVRVVSGTLPVPGVAVSFSAAQGGTVSPSQVTTNSAGEAETHWTLGTATGTQTLTATAAGFQASVTAIATSPPVTFTSVTANPTAIVVGGVATITVTLRTTNLSQPAGGRQVTFSSGGNGSFNPSSVVTDANGQATTAYTGGSAGSVVIMAQSGDATGQTTITVTDVATQLVKVSGDGQTAHVGQQFGAPMVVEARNAQGKPVAGVEVQFETFNIPARATTGPNGQASITYNLVGFLGTGSVVVTLVSNPAVSVTFTYTLVP